MQTLLVSDKLTSFNSISNQAEIACSGTHLGRSLVIIDTALEDYATLIAAIPSGYEVHLLNASQCGIAQITQVLREQVNIASLHILSHGRSGELLLGNSTLNLENLSDYVAQLQVWRSALSENGEILLYGCEVAKGDRGLQFIHQLAEKTASAIAASTTLTGDANQGGDWELQVRTRSLQTAFLSLNHYRGVLVTFGNPIAGNVGNGPAAVAVGDLNGDGNLDILTSDLGQAIGNFRIGGAFTFLGDGKGDFTSGSTLTTLVGTAQGNILADVNDDEKLDFINLLQNGDVTISFGNGNGSFLSTNFITLNKTASSIALGDFDGDKLPDLVITTADGAVVLRNTGGGNFASPSNVATGGIGYPRDVAVGDINNDGDLDLVIASPDATPSKGTSLSIRLGSINATFTGTTDLTTDIGANPTVVQLADIDKDNKLDLLILDSGANNILVRKNLGNGTFANSTTVFTKIPGTATDFKVVDLNRDGNLDLVIGSYESKSGTTFGSAWVLTGNGTGSFSRPTEIPLGPDFTSSEVAVGDFNRDGRPDIVVGNTYNAQSRMAVVLQVNAKPTGNVTITGTARDGHLLTANTDGLRDDDGLGSLSYQWQVLQSGIWRDLSGAVGKRFMPKTPLVGLSVRVKVSYTDLQGTQETVFSNASRAIARSIIIGTQKQDILNGTASNDLIWGRNGADVLRGFAGDDFLHAGAGDDILQGGAGNDILYGGAGRDRLTGGTGRDTFAMHPGSGLDIVTDFQNDIDRIGLSGGLKFSNLWIRQAIGGTEIGVKGQPTALMMLNNVLPGQITAADFTNVTL